VWKRWRTPTKCSSLLKNCYDMHILQSFGHTLSIVKNKHRRDKKILLITHDNDLCTSNKNWIKTKMKTPIHLNSKGNKVIAWCSLSIWSCLFLNNHHCYMCYRCPCSLHHICVSWVSNDDIHQSSDVISNDKNIQLLSYVVREKVGDLPTNMCSIL
jgi:hypothetical protein